MNVEQIKDCLRSGPFPGTLRAATLDTIQQLEAENERLRAALKLFIEAHETGRYEPQRIAYDAARNTLADLSQ